MTTGYALNLGSGVSLPGTGYPDISAFTLSVTANLQGAFFLADGADRARDNWGASGKSTIVGSPVWGSAYAEFDINNHLLTGVAETAAMTVLAVVKRKTTATAVGFMGNYYNGTAIGFALDCTISTGYISAIVGRVSGQSIKALTASNMDNWSLISLTIPATGAFTLKDHTTGLSVNSTETDDRSLFGFGNIRLGNFPQNAGGYENPVFINSALMYSTNLSALELASAAADLRTYAAAKGLTV